MSFIFDIDGQTVWSPALAVGTVFAGYVTTCGQVIGTPPGFTWNSSDTVVIDAGEFNAFVGELFRRSHVESRNDLFQSLIGPVLVPSVVMLQRTGRTVSSTQPTAWRIAFGQRVVPCLASR